MRPASSIPILVLPLVAVALCSCGGDREKDPGPSDGDTDTDGDGDTDSDTDSGTGSDSEYDCEYDCAAKWDETCCPNPYGYDYGYADCTDTTSDDYNCGGCGIVCDEGTDRWCIDSECVCVWDECDGVCVDLQSDSNDCGKCGHRCPADARACDEGACVTCEEVDLVLCNGNCADTRVDDANCGSCGTRCRRRSVCAGAACIEGTCDVACHDETICCDNPWGGAVAGCTDPTTDRTNCGGCGIVCTEPEWCDGGVCTCSTPFGAEDDPVRLCDGSCVDTRTDPQHCGDCATACAKGEDCADGRCG